MAGNTMLACIAVAAFAAFVVPSPASAASPRLCETAAGEGEPCTNLGANTLLTATNVGETHFRIASGGELTCTSAVLTGTLTANTADSEPIEADITTASITSTGISGDCTGSGILGQLKVTTNIGKGTPWCVKARAGGAMELQVRGGNCSEAAKALTFVLDSTSLGLECKYERTTATGPVTGTYNTDEAGQDAIWTIVAGANSTFVREAGSSGFCPERLEWEMAFTLETDESRFTPLYIK